MGFALEVELIRVAREYDLLTTPYVFSIEDAQAMAAAGADVVVCHFGLTTAGSIGAETALTLDQCVAAGTQWAKAAREIREDVIVLAHGGPVGEPADAEYVLRNAEGIDGFYGASSMERLPAERAILEQTRAFTRMTFG